ncbi:hypothetical protein [Actinoplanes italicus]|uniref:hypothetical protein n=1 Tax=Actinoplanes italicus TaxID=113567 RepID=UPI0011B2513F|nr:hypothetical protein [Actinoplanes italicus]
MPGLVLLAVVLLGLCAFCSCGTDDEDEPRSLSSSPSPSPSSKPTPIRVVPTADVYAGIACDTFSSGYRATMTASARIDLAKQISGYAEDSETAGVRKATGSLAKNALTGGKGWKASGAAFVKWCKARGWVDYTDSEDGRSRGDSYNGGGDSDGGGWSRRRGRGWW